MSATLADVASIVAILLGAAAILGFVYRVLSRLAAIVHAIGTVAAIAPTVHLLTGGFEMLKAWKVETDLRILRIETHLGLPPLPTPTPPAPMPATLPGRFPR